MSGLELAKRWWQEYTGEDDLPFDGDTPAWLVSLVVHVAVLLGMASAVTPPPEPSVPAITILQPPESEDPDVLDPETLAVAEEPRDQVGGDTAVSTPETESVAPVVAETSVVAVDAPEVLDTGIEIETLEDSVPTGLDVAENVQVKGDVAVGTAGSSGAVDRLTAEIAASLDQRPTIVCWVFDQSVSLAGQRKEISTRLGRVFDELGVGEGGGRGNAELYNLVYAFGDRVTPVIDKPTRETDKVVKAIESIPVDPSGIELTFTAIHEASKRAAAARSSRSSRNVMVIAFTDEVGNDQDKVDEVAKFCHTNAVRVFVVGVPAPFGRKQVPMRFVEFDEKYDSGEEQWPVVDQGPETLRPEVVRIKSTRVSDEPIDSGFGPFSLSKLCAQTGGIYFCVHANRGASGRVGDAATAPMSSRLRYFFEHDAMKAYRPDYMSQAEIKKRIDANKAKASLVKAAEEVEKRDGLGEMKSIQLTFPRETEGQLVELLSDAQKESATLLPRIEAVQRILEEGKADRAKVTEKRWQAGYDLALGRVQAVYVRTFAYNSILGNAKSTLKFKDPKSDTWELVPSQDMGNVDSKTKKAAEEAKLLLERVVAEHPGTPWALLAAEELKTPLGYAWQEKFTNVVGKKAMPGPAGTPAPAADPKSTKLAPPKPKRPLKNL